ncbi:MAG: YjbQ family protein [Rhodospirillales bacterium]|nr:YjbQ family protein [Rhodospirillales bacterium]
MADDTRIRNGEVTDVSLRQASGALKIHSEGQGLYDITRETLAWLAHQRATNGLLTLFCRHTSASLIVQENADPDVLRDLQSFFRRLVGEDRALYRHTMEGDDDMPAHIRSALTAVQLSIPVAAGKLVLGAWQGIYLFEHRRGVLDRQIALHYLGC